MDTAAQTIADLERAEHAFNREFGKHTREEALEVLAGLDLGAEAQELISGRIDRAFERDAFAGYLRYDGILQYIQIDRIRLQRASKES